MKVLHIIPSLDPKSGGVCQAVRSMIQYVNDGVRHEVVSLDDPTEEFITDSDFTIHALGKGKTAWNY
ncbi:MAG: glycosyl transferase family 1, partial [Sphingobacteriales bacterium]